MQAGGFISDGRVNGSLNLSRALGDLEYKRVKGLPPAQQMITAMPEIRSLELHSGDEFLVLACDGIWDVLSNQQVLHHLQSSLFNRSSRSCMTSRHQNSFTFVAVKLGRDPSFTLGNTVDSTGLQV